MFLILVLISSVMVGGVVGAPCKMSPLTRFLSEEQQKTLHNLITSSRISGANEKMVKESMDEYLAQIMSSEKLVEFKKAHDEFEKQRRQKRSSKNNLNNEKEEPKKIYDIFDKFNDYGRFYEENLAVRMRKL